MHCIRSVHLGLRPLFSVYLLFYFGVEPQTQVHVCSLSGTLSQTEYRPITVLEKKHPLGMKLMMLMKHTHRHKYMPSFLSWSISLSLFTETRRNRPQTLVWSWELTDWISEYQNLRFQTGIIVPDVVTSHSISTLGKPFISLTFIWWDVHCVYGTTWLAAFF